MKYPVAGTPHLGGPGAAFWEALGRLGRAFLGDLVAHRFFIDFLSVFRRFWNGFWYEKSKNKQMENAANFEEFFLTLFAMPW